DAQLAAPELTILVTSPAGHGPTVFENRAGMVATRRDVHRREGLRAAALDGARIGMRGWVGRPAATQLTTGVAPPTKHRFVDEQRARVCAAGIELDGLSNRARDHGHR